MAIAVGLAREPRRRLSGVRARAAYGAGVEKETTEPKEAYAGMEVRDVAYQDGWLPDL